MKLRTGSVGVRNTLQSMHSAFDYVIWIVCGIGIVIGFVALAGSGKTWEELGKHGLLMERERSDGAVSAAALAERDAEIRQMLEARNARRARRGEAPVDVEAELQRLTAPVIDEALRGEIRDLVIARNHRRARRGLEPLNVDREVEREIARLLSPS